MPTVLRVALAVLVTLLAQSEGVQAQGLTPQFGHGPPPRLYGYQGVRSPYRSPHSWSGPRAPEPYWRDNSGDDRAFEAGSPTTYRTLCVRLCDGFYFPISFATNGSGLARDADRCSASCGGEARLFYHANPGGDANGMVDLTGLAYGGLPNAFKYRKALVEGCQCRPEPWSDAEQQRHRAYVGAASAPATRNGEPPTREYGANSEALARPAAVDRDALESFDSPAGAHSSKPHSGWPGNRRPRY